MHGHDSRLSQFMRQTAILFWGIFDFRSIEVEVYFKRNAT
jgi:hypothetical protein